jgi:acetyl esterase/lipase
MDSVARTPKTLLQLGAFHPELDQWLEKNRAPAAAFEDLSELRINYEEWSKRYLANLGKDLDSGVAITDGVVMARDNHEIQVRTYRPAAAKQRCPLIIAIHGGAKVMGSLTDKEGRCRVFSKTFNTVCVNVGYRLAPEHQHPVMVHDCLDITKWALENAAALNADPRKGFILEGTSAGANLADVVAHLARDEKLDPPVTGLIEICISACQVSALPERFKPELVSWD